MGNMIQGDVYHCDVCHLELTVTKPCDEDDCDLICCEKQMTKWVWWHMKVNWDEKTCIHSAECVKNLPSVFTKQDGKFVIIQDGAPEEEIRKVVKGCPSGALKIEE